MFTVAHHGIHAATAIFVEAGKYFVLNQSTPRDESKWRLDPVFDFDLRPGAPEKPGVPEKAGVPEKPGAFKNKKLHTKFTYLSYIPNGFA